MKKSHFLIVSKLVLLTLILFFTNEIVAQGQKNTSKQPNEFWQNVQFGGGLGLGFGSGYTDITISPSAIYNINQTVSIGTSLQFGYISAKNNYNTTLYGGSLIGLVNPIPEIQFSVEIEEVNASTKFQFDGGNLSTNFWNTALYLGAGYRNGNVTIGGRYDILYNANNSIYSDAFMPFVRVYF